MNLKFYFLYNCDEEAKEKEFYQFCQESTLALGKIENKKPEVAVGRGADLVTALVEVANTMPDIATVTSGFSLTKNYIADFLLYKTLFEGFKKSLKKREILVIMPKETVFYNALIALIKKCNKFYKRIDQIRYLDCSDFVNLHDVFCDGKMRESTVEEDKEIQDDRTHFYIFEIKYRNSDDPIRYTVIANKEGDVLSVTEISRGYF